MDIRQIRDRVKATIPKPIGINRRYSVLIPLIKKGDKIEVLFELRSKHITQPGEISFPGGEVEAGESYEKAAIRETMEELNIGRENIEILGEIDYLVSYSNITIHSFVGILSGIDPAEIEPNKYEVDHIFTVPLDFFLDNEPDTYYLDLETVLNDEFPYNLIPKGRDYNWGRGKHTIMFYGYEDYNIWGFTARMMKQFINIIRDQK